MLSSVPSSSDVVIGLHRIIALIPIRKRLKYRPNHLNPQIQKVEPINDARLSGEPASISALSGDGIDGFQRLRKVFCIRLPMLMRCLRPKLHRFFYSVGIKNGNRRFAVIALCRFFQIDRCAAARASHFLDLRPNLAEFRWRQRANKLLFPQELKEGRESPVLVGATVIRKCAGLAEVIGESQIGRASRTAEG